MTDIQRNTQDGKLLLPELSLVHCNLAQTHGKEEKRKKILSLSLFDLHGRLFKVNLLAEVYVTS